MKSIAFFLLPAAAMAAEPQYQALELFNGKDLSGWKGEGYEVKDGAIVCTPQGKNLTTERSFANYVLEFQFKLPPGGNNGIGIHYPGSGDAAYVGMEVQVLDNSSDKYKSLEPAQFHGSIYKLAAAKKAPLKPVGEWNTERIHVEGSDIQVVVNGEVITVANLDQLNKEFPQHKGAQLRSGQITLCGHGDPVAFRDIKIYELPPKANEALAKQHGYTKIFDGTTLNGWESEEGDKGHWVPVNGILKYDGRSEAKDKDLWFSKEYGDMTMTFDWRWSGTGPLMKRPVIGPDGKETGEQVEVQELDSGVYLRGNSKSQVNLWNWPCGSGEVYGYRTDKSQPAEVIASVTPKVNADKPVGTWNRTTITIKGDRLTVGVNGLTVIEEAQLPGVPAKGKIALQHHGAAIDFANIWIKEL